MCGIMGYYCFGDNLPDKEKISNMFTLLETRGRDASGFAFIRENNLIVHKAPVRSSDMVKTDEWKELLLPPIMILHARAKTQGTEKNNANNHPLFNKQGLCIVHNGIIYNDREIFGKNQRDAEVDSEAILAVLSAKHKGDKIKRVFEKLEGSFSVAIIDKSEPTQLTLVKKDNPLDLYYDESLDVLYFCSEREIMREALKTNGNSKRVFNLGENSFHHYEMENNHALIINKEGVESYQRYKPRRDDWSYRSIFRKPESSFKDELIIECPWCLEMTVYNCGKLINRCEHCGMEIEEEGVY
jgi:glucosamine 6-phosphate synthetase-like amidotransferase/phosphosugar isomerase protein